jgi:hypothetical protein
MKLNGCRMGDNDWYQVRGEGFEDDMHKDLVYANEMNAES